MQILKKEREELRGQSRGGKKTGVTRYAPRLLGRRLLPEMNRENRVERLGQTRFPSFHPNLLLLWELWLLSHCARFPEMPSTPQAPPVGPTEPG